MECPNCGHKNRSDARFCKQCGQVLQALQAQAAPPPSPASQGAICPACGATAKPGAHFCPRCGKSLPAEPGQPPPAIPSPPAAQMPTQPSLSALPTTYAQPPSQPPPPAAAPAVPAESRFPRWMWLTGGIAAFVFVAVLIVLAIVMVPKFLSSPEEPTPTPTPTETPAPTSTATALPTEPPATQIPTLVPPTNTPPPPTETPLPAFDASVNIIPSVETLRVNESLKVTITVSNNGQTPFGIVQYQLLGQWESCLTTDQPVLVPPEVEVHPGLSHKVAFVLEAIHDCQAVLEANVIVKTIEQQPATKSVSSAQPVTISVTQ